ncbi:hypothetical protein [Undibacterium curvum]|uniref:Uncharacterized protein n=1 Tax=Undibacterium curvum TaxID=2762294 RepID=A0ABR7A0G0_9BURK|nr:hypothetical protein [Undibacterium curvum]MBC3930406.1 hypothetical protein [Undibacterium curvum]
MTHIQLTLALLIVLVSGLGQFFINNFVHHAPLPEHIKYFCLFLGGIGTAVVYVTGLLLNSQNIPKTNSSRRLPGLSLALGFFMISVGFCLGAIAYAFAGSYLMVLSNILGLTMTLVMWVVARNFFPAKEDAND